MSAVRRLAALECDAGNLLKERGYDIAIVSAPFCKSRYIPYNIMAHRVRENGSSDKVLVKLKVALHKLDLREAEVFCRDEIAQRKGFFAQLPPALEPARFEVWVSIPSDRVQQFEIGRDGIREISSVKKQAAPAGDPS